VPDDRDRVEVAEGPDADSVVLAGGCQVLAVRAKGKVADMPAVPLAIDPRFLGLFDVPDAKVAIRALGGRRQEPAVRTEG
jgi:hypothetical protein